MGNFLHDLGLQDLGLWPLEAQTVAAVLTGYLIAVVLRSWRDAAVLVGIAAWVLWPLKLIGSVFGWRGFDDAIFAAWTAADGSFQFPVRPTAAVIGSMLVAAIALLAWKKFTRKTTSEDVRVSEEEWMRLGALSAVVLAVLTPFLHLWTVFVVPASVGGLVATFLLPGLAQIYWIVALWPKSDSLLKMCLIWLAALVVWFTANWMIGNRRREADGAAQNCGAR